MRNQPLDGIRGDHCVGINAYENLLAAQMQHELGEIDDEEMAAIESSILERLREIREARGEETSGLKPGSRVVGVEVSADVSGWPDFEDEDLTP